MAGHHLDFDRVAGLLQDAVVSPQLWPDVLDDLSQRVEGAGCLLLSTVQRSKQSFWSRDVDALSERYFQESWHERDERYGGIEKLATFGLITDADCVSPDTMTRSEFYTDLLAQEKLRYFAGIGFRAGEDLWCLAIQRSIEQGPFPPSELDKVHRLLRPLSDAATLSKAISATTINGIAFGLDAVRRAAFVCDARGHVTQFNATGEALLGSFIDRDRQITFPGRARHVFERFIKDALDVAGDRPAHAASVRVEWPGRRIALRAIRLAGDVRHVFSQAHLLVLARPEQPHPEEVLGGLYGLTASEIRVALALASGASVDEIATNFAIQPTTVRTHLKAIFAKTSTTRQPQLVAFCNALGWQRSDEEGRDL